MSVQLVCVYFAKTSVLDFNLAGELCSSEQSNVDLRSRSHNWTQKRLTCCPWNLKWVLKTLRTSSSLRLLYHSWEILLQPSFAFNLSQKAIFRGPWVHTLKWMTFFPGSRHPFCSQQTSSSSLYPFLSHCTGIHSTKYFEQLAGLSSCFGSLEAGNWGISVILDHQEDNHRNLGRHSARGWSHHRHLRLNSHSSQHRNVGWSWPLGMFKVDPSEARLECWLVRVGRRSSCFHCTSRTLEPVHSCWSLVAGLNPKPKYIDCC